jgi:hypothetical protein
MERRLRTVTGRFEDVPVGRDSTIREAAQRGWSHERIAEVAGLSEQQVGKTIGSRP